MVKKIIRDMGKVLRRLGKMVKKLGMMGSRVLVKVELGKVCFRRLGYV